MALLRNGHRTLIAISGITALFEEIEVQPMGLDAGGPISQVTMRTTLWRTASGKPLISATKVSVKVAYDPLVLSQMSNILGKNRSIVLTFANGNTLTFWGFVDKFTPDTATSEDRPEAMLEIEITNLDASNVETGPVMVAATTTVTTTTTPAP